MHSNTTNANQVQANLLGLVSDGYELGTVESVNLSGSTYVGWAWDAGTSTVTNNDGSITSQVRANPSAGFSIVSYTGNGTDNATFGHGLNAAPEFIIVKRRDSADDWFVYSLPTAGNILKLNATDAKSGSSHFRTMSSSTFQLSGNSDVNANNGTFVAYCFAPVEGYSAMGSYEATTSADGPFVYLGFKPRFLMIKNADDTQYATSYSWVMIDTERYPSNTGPGSLNPLYANNSASENLYGPGSGAATELTLDILSNGFKPRSANAEYNNGGTYLYLAFAEHPFKTARAR